jgi:cysteine desulfurase/selenocysteine lyase
MVDIDQLLAAEFPVEDKLCYLNHAAVAPWPRRTAEAVARFAEECATYGARDYAKWVQLELSLRQQCAALINAPDSNDIALQKNTSEALSVVAHGFPWEAGDNVIISNEEFPSNRIVWESLAEYGVTVREVDLASDDSPEAALMAATDERSRLLSISSVQYASGLRLDLTLLGQQCHERGIAYCVDAIQGLGVFRHDVQAMHIDFLMADAHKWLLGPEGIALFYCSPQWRERLRLHQFGWHMVADPLDFDRRDWLPANSGQRFECGSPNMLGIHALHASLSLLLEIGIDKIEQRVLERSEYLFQAIDDAPSLTLVSNQALNRYAGIVAFAHNRDSAEKVHQRLIANDVICALRGGNIRFSPHCYTTMSTLTKAMESAN